ncbi:MAG: LptF/LptG family permease [Lentisphaerae bacterium]|nr:LptF/LptG family permease [Lentisphaerota bacterium]
MKILDRYMLRSLLVPLAYCLAAFSMLFVILDLFDHLSKFLESHTPGYMIAAYYAALLMPTFEYIAPAALMLGTLYALWHLTRSNELIAMQASGVSMYRILLPFLAVGLAFTVVLGIAKETIGTRAFVWTTKFRESRFTLPDKAETIHLVYYDTVTHRQWFVDQFDEHDPGHLVKVKVTQERPDGTRVRDLVATRAEYLDGTWWFHDLCIQRYDEADNPIGTLTPVTLGNGHVQEMAELTETPDSLVIEARNWLFLSTLNMLRYLREHPDISRDASKQKWYDVHSRLATPWACLVVTLFGIPAGAKTGRQSPLTGIFLAIGFFFAYYALSQVGLLLGKSGVVRPWLGAWLSNIVFFFSGVAMLVRMR